mmetsp:Transcript_14762/g.37863  ORF Transcript_14762/g.37863 Transcript_14762/m.37863 type:complete len:231 (-) Transcript_14762:222-914(-)
MRRSTQSLKRTSGGRNVRAAFTPKSLPASDSVARSRDLQPARKLKSASYRASSCGVKESFGRRAKNCSLSSVLGAVALLSMRLPASSVNTITSAPMRASIQSTRRTWGGSSALLAAATSASRAAWDAGSELPPTRAVTAARRVSSSGAKVSSGRVESQDSAAGEMLAPLPPVLAPLPPALAPVPPALPPLPPAITFAPACRACGGGASGEGSSTTKPASSVPSVTSPGMR